MRSASICGLSAASLCGRAPDLGQSRRAERGHTRAHLLDQIGDKRVQNLPQSLVNHQLRCRSGIARERGIVEAAEERRGLAHLLDRQNAGVQPVVEIGGQIGDLVGQVDQLRLKRRKRVKKILGQFGVIRSGVVARVLHDALAHCERQIQSAERRVPFLKPCHDAQRVQIVVEAQTVSPQRAVERLFSGVPKGRMPDVVRQRQRFGQLRIQPQSRCHGARNLRHFKSVGQAAAKVVRQPLGGQAGKDLRLAGQAAKGARVQDAGGVARKRSAISVQRLGVGAPCQFAVRAPVHGDSRGQYGRRSQS